MKDTARIILTAKCPRDCSYCANKKGGLLEGAIPIRGFREWLDTVAGYSAVCLTGGEPMVVMPDITLAFARLTRTVYPGKKIYAYVSDYSSLNEMRSLLEAVDGVTYTLHAPYMPGDFRKFLLFQAPAAEAGGSHRLVVNRDFNGVVLLNLEAWASIDIKKFTPPDGCNLPANEDLFAWRPEPAQPQAAATPGRPRFT